MDYLYTNISFSQDPFKRFRSKQPADGGLAPGKLTFAEDFARFADEPFETALWALVNGAPFTTENLGGPAIVALVHAAQLTRTSKVRVSFSGVFGDDPVGERIYELAAPSGVDLSDTARVAGRSSSTIVLSDPSYDEGAGERCFINDIGSARRMTPDRLSNDFFGGDMVLFGGTALVPPIHDELAALARRAHEAGALTICGTVYDFRNEQRNPGAAWPLGSSEAAYPWIDLLITDREEILRLTNAETVPAAVSAVLARGTGAVVVTQGTEPSIAAVGDNGRSTFAPLARRQYPISAAVTRDLAARAGADAAANISAGDTTGCGDNFVGGVLASLALQLDASPRKPSTRPPLDLDEALAWATASGGFACFYPGGTYQEAAPGDKRLRIEPYVRAYRRQLAEERNGAEGPSSRHEGADGG